MKFFTFVAASVLIAVVGSLALSQPAGSSIFYTFRRDLRRCASPQCGGYFIKAVNQSRTRCANNRYQPECYVANIEWDGQAEPENNTALIRGTLRPGGNRWGRLGVLRVSEVWQAASANQPSGIFFRVRDRGIRCIAAPCQTHHEVRLNSTTNRNVAGVDLTGAGASDNTVTEANATMTGPEGIIVSGTHAPVTGPAGRSQMLKATQFYLRPTKTRLIN